LLDGSRLITAVDAVEPAILRVQIADLEHRWTEAVEAMRERCAAVADEVAYEAREIRPHGMFVAHGNVSHIAKRIRALKVTP